MSDCLTDTYQGENGELKKIQFVTTDGCAFPLLESMADFGQNSIFAEFDHKRSRHYPHTVPKRTRKWIQINEQMIDAARQRGIRLSEYIEELYVHQCSSHVAYVATIFRGFALLEMARVPVDPAYCNLVDGVLGGEIADGFRRKVTTGNPGSLIDASAELLKDDSRGSAVRAVLDASSRANVMHEGFLEASRLLEATYYR